MMIHPKRNLTPTEFGNAAREFADVMAKLDQIELGPVQQGQMMPASQPFDLDLRLRLKEKGIEPNP